MSDPLRLFLALELPRPVRESLEEIQRGLKRTGADVRWVRIPSIHLTVKFLGEVAPERVEEIAAAVRAAAGKCPVLALRPRSAGFFPAPRNPRVVWAGLEGDLEDLRNLAQEVESALVSLGFPVEEKGFSPHLTLGRVRSNRSKRELIEAVLDLVDYRGPEFAARELVLFSSDLRPSGAVYTALQWLPLAG